MNEQYVTYKVAKLLREKGFRGYCIAYYNEDGKKYLSLNADLHPLPCPTQAVACRWLREVHNIFIMPTIDSDVYRTQKIFYGAMIASFNNNGDISYHGPLYENGYNEPEDAIEAALEYSLENLF